MSDTFKQFRLIPRDSAFLQRKLGSRGEIFFDEDSNTLRLYDGKEEGGVSLAKDDLSNVDSAAFKAKADLAGVGSSASTISATPPLSPTPGEFWIDFNTGIFYVYYNDGTSSQWIQPANNGVTTPNVEAINFPSNPTLNQTLSQSNITWRWDGVAWTILPNNNPTFTSLSATGNLLVGGNATITGNTVISGNAVISGSLTATGNITGLSLSDLSDINLTGSLGSNFLLSYDLTTQRWRPVPPAAGGVVTPGGNTGYIQFNTNNSFDGDVDLTYNSTSNTLSTVNVTVAGTLQSSGLINSTNTTSSIDSTTGSITTAGGVGIAGQLNVAGTTSKFTSNTSSESSTTGAVVVSGGVGVGGSVNVENDITTNGNVVVATDPTQTSHATNKGYVDRNITAFAIAFGA